MIDLLLFWSLIGGYVYMWLCTHREPPESKAICWLITIACGPGVWAYVIGRWWNEKMKEAAVKKPFIEEQMFKCEPGTNMPKSTYIDEDTV